MTGLWLEHLFGDEKVIQTLSKYGCQPGAEQHGDRGKGAPGEILPTNWIDREGLLLPQSMCLGKAEREAQRFRKEAGELPAHESLKLLRHSENKNMQHKYCQNEGGEDLVEDSQTLRSGSRICSHTLEVGLRNISPFPMRLLRVSTGRQGFLQISVEQESGKSV